MARIRSIKPEFFTSEDTMACSPLARLFYIGLWCEADREGRFTWRAQSLRVRYLPADDCDIEAIAEELIERGMLELYSVDDEVYGWLPKFAKHQVVNNRESGSTIPEITPESRIEAIPLARVKVACTRVPLEGREGKEGRKGTEEVAQPRSSPARSSTRTATRIPEDFELTAERRLVAEAETLPAERVFAKFVDHWRAASGANARKRDWDATWRNWCRNETDRNPRRANGPRSDNPTGDAVRELLNGGAGDTGRPR